MHRIKRISRCQYCEIGIVLIIVSNTCFYTINSISIYLLLSIIGIILIGYQTVSFASIHLISRATKWLICTQALFFVYGTLFLRSGYYNWDALLFFFCQNIFLSVGFSYLFWKKGFNSGIERIAVWSAIACGGYFAINEIPKLWIAVDRIGASLSGDVNTVASNFGILIMLLAYSYCVNQKAICIWFVAILGFMSLLTGSKSIFIYFAGTMLYFYFKSNNSKKHKMLVVTVATLIALLLIVFRIEFLYEIIGVRIQDMLFQLFGFGHGKYSHSTDARLFMVLEGVRLFLQNPLFGGGGNYFGAMTETEYAYSHNNMVELLCNMGIFGAGVYYFPLIRNLINGIRKRRKNRDMAWFLVFLLVTSFMSDQVHMTHSEPCVGYIPMILSFVIADNLKS